MDIKKRASKIYTTNPSGFPRAKVVKSTHNLKETYKNLKPMRASRGARNQDTGRRTGLLDQHGDPLFDVNLEGKPNNKASDGIRRDSGIVPNMAGGPGGGSSSSFGPSREFYDFRATATFWQLPQQHMFKELNFLRRAMYLRDEIIGPGLDLLSEIPYGPASFTSRDNSVKKIFEDAADATNLMEFIPRLTLHYLVHGEAIPWHWWDDSEGYWGHLYSIDPNDVEIASFPYSHAGDIIQIKPGEAIRYFINSRDPAFREIQRNIPPAILKALRSRKKMPLNPKNATYLLRESFPLQDYYGYQIRGQSIIDRLFRIWIYYEKVMEAEMAIADNYIYPLNFVKIGDDKFRPGQEDLELMSQMIEQSRFDVRPFIVYHNALELDRIEYGGSFGDLTDRFDRIDDLKLIALGIAKDILFGESTLASSRTEMQILLMRLSTLRSKIEDSWLYPKYLDPIAEAHEIYETTPARTYNKIRVKEYKTVYFRDPENPRNSKVYSRKEEDKTLATPQIEWQTRLHAVQDSDYIDQLNDLFTASRDKAEGLVSPSTRMAAVGLDFEKELTQMKRDYEIIDKYMGDEDEEDYDEDTTFGSKEGGWLKKLRNIITGNKRNDNNLLAKDVDAINKFFAQENDILYKTGVKEQYSPTNSIRLYAGATMSTKRKGNLLDSVILPPDIQMECSALDDLFVNKLSFIDKYDDNFKEHVIYANDSVMDIIDESIESDNAFEDIVDRFAVKNPEYIEFIYDQGKKHRYKMQGVDIIKMRKENGLVDEQYNNRRYGTTISNFDDINIVNEIKQALYGELEEISEKIAKDKNDLNVKSEKDSDKEKNDSIENIANNELYRDREWKLKKIIGETAINTYNLAVLNGMIEQGHKHFKWSRDDISDTCPICRARHGKIYEIETFLKQYNNKWCEASHSNCFKGDTKILMSDHSFKYIKDVKEGDVVMGKDSPTTVIRKQIHTHIGNTVKINGVISTMNHPYFYMDDDKIKEISAHKINKDTKLVGCNYE